MKWLIMWSLLIFSVEIFNITIQFIRIMISDEVSIATYISRLCTIRLEIITNLEYNREIV